MSIRSEATEKAKKLGLCSQCHKNKAATNPRRLQCWRCINTNRKKRIVKEEVMTTQQSTKVCITCNKNPRNNGTQFCYPCINEKRRKTYRSKAKTKGLLTEKQRDRISRGMKKSYALKKARKDAFNTLSDKKDEAIEPKRSYVRRAPTNSIQMAGMIFDLESFISKIQDMSATEYLKSREALITNILKRR